MINSVVYFLSDTTHPTACSRKCTTRPCQQPGLPGLLLDEQAFILPFLAPFRGPNERFSPVSYSAVAGKAEIYVAILQICEIKYKSKLGARPSRVYGMAPFNNARLFMK